jgi:XapX domain-containing protein
MKAYVVSIAAGILVGIVYSLLQVRSPAPPLIALAGLLGILVGEQVMPVARHIMSGSSLLAACARPETRDHLLGQLPGRNQHPERTRSGAAS